MILFLEKVDIINTMHFKSRNHPISVVIFYVSGKNPDDKDTLEGVKGLVQSLKRIGYPVRKKLVTKKNWRRAVHTPGDVVFNFVEDTTWSLYTKVGKRLEALGRAQAGHDLQSFRYATSKASVKRRMRKMRIRTPNYRIFRRRSKIGFRGLTYPIIVKPSREHAGIGISQHSVVSNEKELKKRVLYLLHQYPGEVVAEEFIQGAEIHVTIMGNGAKLIVFPLCEISFGGKFAKHWSVYTYEAKWNKRSWEYWDARVQSPAKIHARLAHTIVRLTRKAYRAFGCRDIARFDVRIDLHGVPSIVDVNFNPSLNFYDTEDATIASVKAYNWTYDQFIQTLVVTAYTRVYGRTPTH